MCTSFPLPLVLFVVLNKYCTRERKMLQLPGNKHSGIKYIKNHILSTCCGQLVHRMCPSLLLLSSSSGIFSSFYVLIHVFWRFEIPPVRCFWQRQVIGGKFVEVGQNKKERSRITSDIPTYFYKTIRNRWPNCSMRKQGHSASIHSLEWMSPRMMNTLRHWYD